MVYVILVSKANELSWYLPILSSYAINIPLFLNSITHTNTICYSFRLCKPINKILFNFKLTLFLCPKSKSLFASPEKEEVQVLASTKAYLRWNPKKCLSCHLSSVALLLPHQVKFLTLPKDHHLNLNLNPNLLLRNQRVNQNQRNLL